MEQFLDQTPAADYLDNAGDLFEEYAPRMRLMMETAHRTPDQVEALELGFLKLAGDKVYENYLWISRGEAFGTFTMAYESACKAVDGQSYGEPFVEWQCKDMDTTKREYVDEFDFGNSGDLYIGETQKQAAHAFFVWYHNKIAWTYNQ